MELPRGGDTPFQRDIRSSAHETNRIRNKNIKRNLAARRGPVRPRDCQARSPWAVKRSRPRPNHHTITQINVDEELWNCEDSDSGPSPPSTPPPHSCDDGKREPFGLDPVSGNAVLIRHSSSHSLLDLLLTPDGTEKMDKREEKRLHRRSNPPLDVKFAHEDTDWIRGFGPKHRWQTAGEWRIKPRSFDLGIRLAHMVGGVWPSWGSGRSSDRTKTEVSAPYPSSQIFTGEGEEDDDFVLI